MHEAVAAIAATGVSPIVRIAANEGWMVKRKSFQKRRGNNAERWPDADFSVKVHWIRVPMELLSLYSTQQTTLESSLSRPSSRLLAAGVSGVPSQWARPGAYLPSSICSSQTILS